MSRAPRLSRSKRRILLALFTFLMPLTVVTGATTALDFENLPAGTVVTNQYVTRRVRFASAFLTTHPAARSGTRVLWTISPSTEVFTPLPFTINFTTPQRYVRLFAMSPANARRGTLRAFDAGGAMIAHDGPRLVAADKFITLFEVKAPGAHIKRAELRLDGASHFAIDDLDFGTVQMGELPVRTIEMQQPSTSDNPSVTGRFSTEFRLGTPPASTSGGAPAPVEGEPEFNMEAVPLLERDLDPGASAELVQHVTGHNGLVGSVRWIGTAAPLRVTLSLNGSNLATGKTYALGENRGGANLLAVANTSGNVKLSVMNISGVRVKVRLFLNLMRGQGQ